MQIATPPQDWEDPTPLPPPPARVAYKQIGPTQNLQPTTDVFSALQNLHTSLATVQQDLVTRLAALQEMVTVTRDNTVGIAASLEHVDAKVDSHVDSLQRYQHQLCQALHMDIHRVSIHLQRLGSLRSRPPAPLVESIARLADQALELYQAQDTTADQ